ncbi:hypothetical protein DKX38_017796 [Salix brachista]|uniref:Xyloglucan endotransglucosylase/hydrolase n=1 Tax=Salix brachista TaxID=2182728 RepID=A0A5N5KWE2_9ROSI|nr:hypothetical protein DKX38_017796 [Salix brachista]
MTSFLASSRVPMLLVLVLFTLTSLTGSSLGNFYQDFDIIWGDWRAMILNDGTVTAYYVSLLNINDYFEHTNRTFDLGVINLRWYIFSYNQKGQHGMRYIDFEFLGNLSGDPYILHTNVYSQGKGDKEQQFYLWFDPTADFHTYSILWNPQRIIFYVDGSPIREFKNMESIGVPFPKYQPIRIYSTLWNADDWATRGGLVKTDWSQAPFTASYTSFNASNACVWINGASSCDTNNFSPPAWLSEDLDSTNLDKLQWVQPNNMIYNYCTDAKRFPQGFPLECNMS